VDYGGDKKMFQLKLIFKLEYNFLPRDLDKLLVSFLKASAQAYSQNFYDSLYDKSKSIIKSYTYACFLPNAKWETDRIILGKNEFVMYFSDANEAQLIRFFNSFQKMKFQRYPMNQNSMQLTDIYMQQLTEVTDTELVVKMQSPLIVRNHNSQNNKDKYYTYKDEDFNTTLKENIKIFLDKMNLNIPCEDFDIQTIKGKKIVKDVFGRKIDASIGIFKISGNPQLLNLLLKSGMGVRRSQGNGKFEVIG
jgi:CRISPR-associated endoribonuclease Cas6